MDSIDGKPLKMSLWTYLSSEVTRGYVLEADEERYTQRRQKIYTFMKIPRELEKFMSYGFFHCLDSFLFLFTFLPIRFLLAAIALVVRAPLIMLGIKRQYRGHVLYPAEIIDLLKGFIIVISVYVMHIYIDTSMMYHIIKSQSVIKLYLFYNMLEVGDRLFSAFGQDTIDALFWTATEPKDKKRQHVGLVPHFLLTITYVILHSLLVLLQATTLNVAVNASNKALLTIMMSNNFVEIKGSVFKKFDKNNLFQVSCSDVRERFHLFALLLVVIVQTMKEYGWKEQSFWDLAPDCLWVLGSEFFVDWIKHAFITRFNAISSEVYKDYTINLAYDLAQTKQKHAFSDHSDIVSRRMGFIPLPLSVVIIRVIGMTVTADSAGTPIIFLLGYLCLVSLRVLCSIVILGKACDLIDQHQQNKRSASISSTSNEQEIESSEAAEQPLASFSLLKNAERQRRAQVKIHNKTGTIPTFSNDTRPPFAQISSNQPPKVQKNRYDNTREIPAQNYLSGSTSPKNVKSKETTSNELKESAILLENKIQAMFGKSKIDVQDINEEKSPQRITGTSDGILFATDYVDGKHPNLYDQQESTAQKKPTESNLSELLANVKPINYAPSDQLIEELTSDVQIDESESKENVNIDHVEEKKINLMNRSNYFLKNESCSHEENIDPESIETRKIFGVKTKENEQIGWSKRRSQLLAAKLAATDSRRRPLSCTPPSTSVDQSSIDEEDESLSCSIYTPSHSSMMSSSSSGKECSNIPPSKLLFDPHNMSRTPSSSFDAVPSIPLEEENFSHDKEDLVCWGDTLREGEHLKMQQNISKRDTSLKAIEEKDNDDFEPIPVSDLKQNEETSSKLWLPDLICQEPQQSNESLEPPPNSGDEETIGGSSEDTGTSEGEGARKSYMYQH